MKYFRSSNGEMHFVTFYYKVLSKVILYLLIRIYNEPIDISKGISYNYQIISWNNEKIHDLKAFYDSSPLSVQCNRSDGERFPVI